MLKENFKSPPQPQENGPAANADFYNTDTLEPSSNDQLQNRKKALIWLTNEHNGQSETQRAIYQTELDRINGILE